MKKIYRKLLVVTSILFICCSSEKTSSEQEQIDSALLELSDSSYYVVDELNERGLLPTSFFSNIHERLDKVMEGSDNNFNYLCYGESVFLESQNIYVPKNIKHVTQIDPKTQEMLHIDLDENYFPIKFEPKLQGPNGLVYTIEYGTNQTTVRVEETQIGVTPTLVKEIILPPIDREIDTTGKISSKSNDDDCKKSIEENMASFNICKEGNIYEEFGDNFENYTDDTYISYVGQFVNYLVKEMKKISCPKTDKNNNSFCSELKASRQNYIKLLNTGEVFGVFGDPDYLLSYQTAGPVWSAGLYGLNSETPTEWPFLNKYFTSYSMEHCRSEDCPLVIHPQHRYTFSRMSMNLAYKNISDVRQVDVTAIYSLDFIQKAGTIWNGSYSTGWGIGYHITGMSSQGPFELHNYDGGEGIN